jgi:hypothetical protein
MLVPFVKDTLNQLAKANAHWPTLWLLKFGPKSTTGWDVIFPESICEFSAEVLALEGCVPVL